MQDKRGKCPTYSTPNSC